MEKEQKLIKNILMYMIANLGAKLLLLIIYPIYTYYVIPYELGVYDLIISTLTLLYPIIVFSINDAVFRWLLDNNEKDSLKVIATGLKITFRNIFIFNIIYIIYNLYFNIEYGWIVLVIINLGSLYPVFQQIARGLKKNKIFALSGLLYAVGLVFFNVIFVILFRLGVTGLLISQIAAYIIPCLFLFLTLECLHTKWWKVNVSKEMENNMIKYSLLLIPNSCCWWIMNASDRYLIHFLLGNTMNGIYAISHKFPSIMNMLTSVFVLAWQEQAILEYSSEERDLYYSKIHRMYYLFLFSMCLLLSPITKWFVIFCIQPDYISAWQYSSTLYLGSIFLALASFLGTGYLNAKNTKGSMITSMLGATVNIIINMGLLPYIGLDAAAISTLLGNMTIWVTRWIQLKKYFTIKMQWGEFIILVVLNVFIVIIIRRTRFITDIIILLVLISITIFLNHELIKELLKAFRVKKAIK